MYLSSRALAFLVLVSLSAPTLSHAHDVVAASGRSPRFVTGRRNPAKAKAHEPAVSTPEIESISSETHPAVAGEVFLADTVVRLIGKGFGASADGARVELSHEALPAPLTLEVLSWRDDEIRVRLPRPASLGIDASTAELLLRELAAPKRYVALATRLAIARADRRIEATEALQIAVVARDFDGDGVDRSADPNDLDPTAK